MSVGRRLTLRPQAKGLRESWSIVRIWSLAEGHARLLEVVKTHGNVDDRLGWCPLLTVVPTAGWAAPVAEWTLSGTIRPYVEAISSGMLSRASVQRSSGCDRGTSW